MDRPGNPTQPFERLEVRRCGWGETFVLRVLSPQYGGLMTHRVRGRGQYCPHPAEPCYNHKLDLQWKGYAAVQVWDEKRELWIAATFELTESFELDVRNQWARGQLWQVSRGPKTEDHGEPVVGRLIDQVDPKTLPPEFNYRPPVHSIYHRFTVDLTTPNPLPDRVVLEPSTGDPPPAWTRQKAGSDDYEAERARLQESARKYLERKAKMNGHKK